MGEDKVCLFDVNETILNLETLDPIFIQIFGLKEYREIWFQSALNTAFALSLTDSYVKFSEILETTLETLASALKINISPEQKNNFKAALAQLKPHSDVIKGLLVLRAFGYRIAALTNSTLESTIQIFEKNNLIPYFERVLSVDSVQTYKPSKKTYAFAARELKVQNQDIWMIAAHPWDLQGAAHAGCKTALIIRNSKPENNLFRKPNFQSNNLYELASMIKAQEIKNDGK